MNANGEQSPVGRGVAAFWITWILLLAGFTTVLLINRRTYETKVNSWRTAAQSGATAGAKFRDRISALVTHPRAEVVRSLAVPLTPAPKWWPEKVNHQAAVVMDPASGFEFDLAFLDDELCAYRVRPKLAPAPPPELAAMEMIRSGFQLFGWALWLGAAGFFIAVAGTPRRRLQLAHAAIAITVASLLAAELSIPHGSPWQAWLFDAFVAAGWVGMAPLSIGMFIWARTESMRRSGFEVIPAPPALAPDLEHIELDEEREEAAEESPAESAPEEPE